MTEHPPAAASDEAGEMSVVEITTVDTYPLRLAVLRADTVSKVVDFAEDSWPGTVHLGVRDCRGHLVATSTWVPRAFVGAPDEPAVQLRGMATASQLQGRGLGALLVAEGCRRAWALGAEVVWANARDRALAFYQRHGFEVYGDGFVEAVTQLPHHLVVRRRDR